MDDNGQINFVFHGIGDKRKPASFVALVLDARSLRGTVLDPRREGIVFHVALLKGIVTEKTKTKSHSPHRSVRSLVFQGMVSSEGSVIPP